MEPKTNENDTNSEGESQSENKEAALDENEINFGMCSVI